MIKFFNSKEYPTKIPFFTDNINKKKNLYTKLHFNKNKFDK